MRGRVAAFAPGRVNLIGEHTDYERGLCLPFAIGLGATVTAVPLPGRTIEVEALDLGERDSFDRGDPGRPDDVQPGWRALARGVIAELRRSGVRPPACRLRIASTLPPGAGLSSSAATAVALCLALGGDELGRIELARLCARVEAGWLGARTGILDQLASLHGREGHALRIDMRGPELAAVALELRGRQLVVLPSGESRELAASGYNERRAECERARELLEVESLREAGGIDFEALPEPYRRRVRHVVTENGRVDRMVAALEAGDLDEAGLLLDASHRSLRDDFDASVPAVERARERCRAAGALGARMMGGGFGGSVLALLPPGRRPPAGAIAVEPCGAARTLPAT
jgi:galactokinase